MREIPLSDVGLISVDDAAARRKVNERTIRLWIQAGLLPVIVVGAGKRATYLLRAADVTAFTAPRRGAPPGNRNAVKDSDAPEPVISSVPQKSGKKTGKP
jgi:hypothetical protein